MAPAGGATNSEAGLNVWRLIRETLLRWLRTSVMLIITFIVLTAITLLTLWILGGEPGSNKDLEGPIPTPYFPDQVTATPST